VAAVVGANGLAIVHLVTTNPLVLDADLTTPTSGWLPGLPYIDGNAGFTMQALGHLAALDWLHGHIPWWNPYEGVGSPLAGEMQSGAFFPPTLLLALHQGVLLLQLLVEAVTGWSTYFLVRRLGVGRTLATAAGVAFGLCGTFAWLAHAPIRPVALLPLCLIGVERAIDAAREQRRGGWRLLGVALALSILAGFPETTFIDGLFVAWWAVLRLAGPGREVWRTALARMAGGVAVGVSLAAPLLVAFADYLPYAYVGSHSGGFADQSLPSTGLVQLVLPYSLGPIFGFQSPPGGTDTISLLWGSVGGFLSVTVIAAGLVGLLGTRWRLLRLGLGAWILVSLLRTFGFPPVVHLMAHIPGLRLTAFYRYSDPTWELAVVVLAALGLDDIARRLTHRRVVIIAAGVTAALAAWAGATAWPLMTHARGAVGTRPGHGHLYPLLSLVGAGLALLLLAGGGLMAAGIGSGGGDAPGHRKDKVNRSEHSEGSGRSGRTRRWGRLIMAGVVGAESIVLLGFTTLSAPPPTHLQAGSVSWLQAHLGPYRFLTLGPIQPNYGSYFGIAQANINDLPVPKAYNDEIASRLDPNAIPGVFSGGGRINPAGPTPAEVLTAHLSGYEAIGVRFVVESANGQDVQGQAFPAVGSAAWPAGPRLVYRDGFAEIWQLPGPAPAFSLRSVSSGVGNGNGSALPASCRIVGVGWDRATVRCSQPSTLVRRTLYLPGWTAASPDRSDLRLNVLSGPAGLFQQVRVPSGTTAVRFTYLPPHVGEATEVMLLAVLVLLGSAWPLRTHRRRRITVANSTDGRSGANLEQARGLERQPNRANAVRPDPSSPSLAIAYNSPVHLQSGRGFSPLVFIDPLRSLGTTT
jgi:hypothetical protein